jgi:GTPase
MATTFTRNASIASRTMLYRFSMQRCLTTKPSLSTDPESFMIHGTNTDHAPSDIRTRFATVALVGAPNAGKSTLMNRIVGGRVAAVSRKVNTTRRQIIGVCTEGDAQLAFCDTPGVVEQQFVRDLGSARRQLAKAAWGAAADSDIVVFVVDASRGEKHWETCATLATQLLASRRSSPMSKPDATLLALNKVDKARPRAAVLDVSQYLVDTVPNFKDSFHLGRPFFISAFNGKGVDELKGALMGLAGPGEFLAPNDNPGALEDMRDLCVEHIWEKLLHRMHQELPYQCEIENEEWKELPNGDISVMEVIRVERNSQIPIFIGPGGETIKWIAEQASLSVSELLGRRVYMRLRVATRKNR